MCAVLLHWSIAGLEHDRQAQLAAHILQARRAEVQYLDLAVIQHHDVRGADVAVDESFLVHLVQRQHHGLQQVERLAELEPPALPRVVGQILPLEVLHDDICRPVLLKVVPERDDVPVPDELGESLGLFKKAALAELERVALYFRRRDHRQRDAAVGGAARVVFLDCDPAVKLQVIADICNAKAARAEHFSDDVSPVQDAVHRQLVLRVLYIYVVPADGALPVHRRGFRHTARAKEHFFYAGLLRMVFYICYIIPCHIGGGQCFRNFIILFL